MKSKLMPFTVCCSLYAICMGQWSSPVPIFRNNPSIAGQSFVAGTGDTMWAAMVVGRAGSSGPYQVLACWTTGDSWSLPAELTPPDSGRIFSEPGMGRDAAGRLWVAWYRGDYPTRDIESSAVWTALRDSGGWHAPARVCSGVAAEGPMSFSSDAAGNWYLGFATLTPYSDFTYSSAVYSRWTGDSWLTPRYIARGMGSPIETDFTAPTLVARPDSGLWASYEILIGDDAISMLKIIQGDTARWCWSANGSAPAATADSAGRLWILYSELHMYWLHAQVIVDSNSIDTTLITEAAEGRSCATTDGEGLVWAAWPRRSNHLVSVNYSRGAEWSPPEVAADSVGVPKGIAADATGRVYVLFQTNAGRLYSVYRTERPGIQEQGPGLAAGSRLATIVRGVLLLQKHSTQNTGYRADLLDIGGRKVMELRVGPNDVSQLSPGVYFVRDLSAVSGEQGAVGKVVIAR